MALKPILTSLDGLDESLAGLYSQADDGTFRLEVETTDGWELANTRALKQALERERGNAKDATQKLEAYAGLTPDEAIGLRGKLDEADEKLRSKKLSDEDGWALREKELAGRQEAEKATWNAEKAELRGLVSTEIVERTAREALTTNGFGHAVDVMLPHVIGTLRPQADANGKLTRNVEVFDPVTGHARIGGSQGEPMSVSQFVKELHQDSRFKLVAEGTGASGGGLNGGAGEKPTISGGRDLSKLTPQQKLEAVYGSSPNAGS